MMNYKGGSTHFRLSLNACSLIAEQIVTGVPAYNAIFKTDNGILRAKLRKEYEYEQFLFEDFEEDRKRYGEWYDDSLYWYYDNITYVLWYLINVEDDRIKANKYAKKIVNRKWKERLEEDIAYV